MPVVETSVVLASSAAAKASNCAAELMLVGSPDNPVNAPTANRTFVPPPVSVVVAWETVPAPAVRFKAPKTMSAMLELPHHFEISSQTSLIRHLLRTALMTATNGRQSAPKAIDQPNRNGVLVSSRLFVARQREMSVPNPKLSSDGSSCLGHNSSSVHTNVAVVAANDRQIGRAQELGSRT